MLNIGCHLSTTKGFKNMGKEALSEKAMAIATKVYEEAAKAREAEAGDDTADSNTKDDARKILSW